MNLDYDPQLSRLYLSAKWNGRTSRPVTPVDDKTSVDMPRALDLGERTLHAERVSIRYGESYDFIARSDTFDYLYVEEGGNTRLLARRHTHETRRTGGLFGVHQTSGSVRHKPYWEPQEGLLEGKEDARELLATLERKLPDQ